MSKFFINRPIVAIVISIITVIVGVVAFLSLPIAQFPKIVPPEARVTTTYVGADAQTVEQSVATPIEQQLSGVDNLNYMFSINGSDGSLRLSANFDVNTDPNTDLILTQMRVTQAGPQLPSDVANFGVTVQKQLTAPLMLVALYSPTNSYDSTFLANYAYININDQLTRVPGIASATVFHATPQCAPVRQPRLQTDGSVSLAKNNAGAKAPASSRMAELSTLKIGQKTKIARLPPISSNDRVTNTCPRQ